MKETEGTADRSLKRARWLAGTAGFVIAATLPVLSLFTCAAASMAGLRMRELLAGKPLPALTTWVVESANFLIGPRDGPWHLVFLTGAFLLVYPPLLIAVRRVGSIGAVSLIFAVWLGLLFSVEAVVVGLMIVGLLLPFVTVSRLY